MLNGWSAKKAIAAPLIALAVGACSASSTDAPQTSSNFAQPATAEVIAVGLNNISDKYIEPVDLNRLGIEGLRGLGAIDAGLTLWRGKSQLAMYENGVEIARIDIPAKSDSQAWATAIVAMTETAREHSSDIRGASSEKILEAIFDGALSDLDIFSRYAGTAQAISNRAKRDGYGGIGIRFRIDGDAAIVTQVLDASPAHSVDLRLGDRIVSIQEKPVSELTSRDITRLIRGPVHSSVKLTVLRNTQVPPIVVDVPRAHIVPETVTARREDNVGLIRIKSFNQDTAAALEKALASLLSNEFPPIHGLVLDLRGNPGGLLRQSIKVADLLLTQGDILRTIGRHPDSLHHYEAGGKDAASGIPLVVVIDGKSASAAEIVAAALQDRDRAVVIGTSSYGKGSVQTVIRLPNDGEITLTWSKFVAPSGYYLHGMGVVPTICTSGKRSLDEADLIISSALMTESSNYAETWQRRALLSETDRRTLREQCPAEKRVGPLDLEIAKQLILDKRSHARALRISTVTAQVSN